MVLRESKDLLEVITEAIGDKKGYDIKIMNVMQATTLTDYFVMCTSDSDVQSRAIANNVNEKLGKIFEKNMPQPEGYANGEWIVIDVRRVIVHIFLPELRERFNLEEFWEKQLEKALRDRSDSAEKQARENGKQVKETGKKASKPAAGKGVKKAGKAVSAKEAVETKLKKSAAKKKSAGEKIAKLAKTSKSAKEAIEEEILKHKAKKETQRETAVKRAAKAKKTAAAKARPASSTSKKATAGSLKKKTVKK
ncbi:MAG: ribosome silencing factor [Candidatus Wallbacteria bacterium]